MQQLLEYHPKTIIVPGNFPIGCIPGYLATFESENSKDYDKNKCLKDFNNFAAYHNEFLEAALKDLQRSHPSTKILYADYYNAFLSIINKADKNGEVSFCTQFSLHIHVYLDFIRGYLYAMFSIWML